MYWVQSQTKMRTDFISSFPQSPLFSYSHSSPYSSSPSLPYNSDYQKQQAPSSGAKINPVIIFIIVILAVLFFVSGLLHLLVRFLIKHRSSSISTESNRDTEMSESGTFQRQLQQLFHLHDSGLDQAFIDALPIFLYEEVMGLKEPFDCAVCLCEFSEQDKLRLLPLCSHAFHIDCIDTWLLSNSTCPLCRGTLYAPGLAIENPIFNFENPREEDCSSGYGASSVLSSQKPIGNEIVNENRVFSVRLGKFRSSLNDGEEERGEVETSSSKLGERRCYSMGSYQYVVADSDLQVTLRSKRGVGESMRLFKGRGGHNGNSLMDGDLEGKKINRGSKGESYSVSKIWLWSKKDKFPSCSETQIGSSSSINSSSGLPSVDRSQGI